MLLNIRIINEKTKKTQKHTSEFFYFEFLSF